MMGPSVLSCASDSSRALRSRRPSFLISSRDGARAGTSPPQRAATGIALPAAVRRWRRASSVKGKGTTDSSESISPVAQAARGVLNKVLALHGTSQELAASAREALRNSWEPSTAADSAHRTLEVLFDALFPSRSEDWASVVRSLLGELCRLACDNSEKRGSLSTQGLDRDAAVSDIPSTTLEVSSLPECKGHVIRRETLSPLRTVPPLQHDTPLVSLTLTPAQRPVSVSESLASRVTPVLHHHTAQLGEELTDGTFTINQYVVLLPLGHGSQGDVFLAMDSRINQLRAIKVVRRPMRAALQSGSFSDVLPTGPPIRGGALAAARCERRRRQLDREIAIMTKCRHRNIVALHEVIDDPHLDVMYLVMQYVENGPIAKLQPDGTIAAPIPAVTIAEYTVQLCAGLRYLHRKGIIHRDIKPDNILLGANNDVYLADFGTSDLFDAFSDHSISDTRGTLAFLPPELVVEGHTVIAEAVDRWALGITLYVLFCGRLPWQARTSAALLNEIAATGDIVPPPTTSGGNDTPDEHMRKLVAGMLRASPHQRSSLEEVSAAAQLILDLTQVLEDEVDLLPFAAFEESRSSFIAP